MNRRDELKIYQVNETTWDSVWKTIEADCSFLTEWGFQTLKDGLKKSVKSIVLEPHYLCKDHRNLYSNYYSKKFIDSSPYASRLHFFSSPDLKIPELLLFPDNYRPSYIGYAVIRPVVDRCVGRTIIDPMQLSTTDKSNFFCLRTEFRAHIGGYRFLVRGYPYISQDGDVTVCAHTSLWGVCRYLSERYTVYKEVYPFDLINLTEHSEGRTFPYRGMTYSDYSSILSGFGTFPIVLRLKDHTGKMYPSEHRQLYTYIESGFPVVGSLPGHVVTIIGHTMDLQQNPTPDSDGLIDSSEFNNQYIVVDDNYFPYQLLGKPDDPNNYSSFSKDDLKTGVFPLPEKVFLPADSAKSWALAWMNVHRKDLESTGAGPFVTRLFLTSNSSFKGRCLQRSVQDANIDAVSYYISG